jgi:hypothetical protein
MNRSFKITNKKVRYNPTNFFIFYFLLFIIYFLFFLLNIAVRHNKRPCPYISCD